MNKGAAGIITFLLIISFKSWGSVPLPQLSYKAISSYAMLNDTIPGKKPEEVEQKQEQPLKEVTDPVIKEVPRSKKQLKPIAVPTKVLPVKAPIIKPKIVIKKIGVRIP
ncbi:hypothetical protein SAMN05518672_104402 [Chitinophaga sp. CF118]|uniref:hypothetical protein n=1 Tax=Chitinophaga sp. CF118 TaxID=1884367 RepID=UPI0008EA3734|nr:hypothetical protein [Chitinophaga sp. CF118]SFE07956.1 hypothetical protein SAMN05518672_104402 [Chitinophaga sp. CF118]